MKKILFVCTGNICRSPMAEGIFNYEVKLLGKDNVFRAWSAGVQAIEHDLPTKNAVEALMPCGIDISSHRARYATTEVIEESFLVIGMTNGHKEELLSRFPKHSDKIFTLHEYVNNDHDRNVDDPYGSTLEVYKDCSVELKEAVSLLVKAMV